MFSFVNVYVIIMLLGSICTCYKYTHPILQFIYDCVFVIYYVAQESDFRLKFP